MRGKALSRALVVAVALAGILAVSPASVPSTPLAAQAYVALGDCSPGADWGTLRQDLTQRVIELVNQHRAARGLAQLQVSTPLTSSAIWKSRHMARYQYMAHNDPAPPVARGVGDRLLACGYPANNAGWGENIAYGYASADAVMQGWLNSPGHRSNIENSSYRAIGVGAASSSAGTLYWTQQFGTTTGGAVPPPQPPAPSPPPPPAVTYACSNGRDDDFDGKVDYPADPGCTSPTDTDEYNAPAPPLPPAPLPPAPLPPAPSPPPPPAVTYACSNGRDDDFDGKVDYPADPGCTSPTDTDEFNWMGFPF